MAIVALRVPERSWWKKTVLVVVTAMGCAGLFAQVYRETEVKAAFLFQFTRYVEYPASAFESDRAPFVMGVLGKSAIIDALKGAVRGKNVEGRPIVVRQMSLGAELRRCHILFVPESQSHHLPEVLKTLADAPVLTVGESAGFASQGGIIGFFTEQNRLRFEINLEAARRAHLTIGSRLLALARIVRGGKGRS